MCAGVVMATMRFADGVATRKDGASGLRGRVSNCPKEVLVVCAIAGSEKARAGMEDAAVWCTALS